MDPRDVVIIGGGPAGAAAGRLLASWGHAVTLVDKTPDGTRGLAESIPPSTHKLFEQIGIGDAIDRAGFLRTSGNTVWWGSRDRRVENFGDQAALGYQVFRPQFDQVLLRSAAAAGVDVLSHCTIRRVDLRDESDDASTYADLVVDRDRTRSTLRSRFVLDCSGRAGVIGRTFRVAEPGHHTLALIGVWQRRDGQGWGLPDDSHTVVETFADGWAWSVPTSTSVRHVGLMVDRRANHLRQGYGGPPKPSAKAALRYSDVIAKTTEVARLVQGATLQRTFSCDASLYSSTAYAGRRHLLVGDAGSFIDPLSSFGVKKALASAWIAAVATHTALSDPQRASVALDFFAKWERDVYASHLRRTKHFSAAATDAEARADAVAEDLADDPDVRRAFESFRAAPRLNLSMSSHAVLEQKPMIRGNEIVLEPALPGGMRYVANVDLLTLAYMAPHHEQVPELFEAYCRTCSPVPLPSVVGGLSLLVARGILHERA